MTTLSSIAVFEEQLQTVSRIGHVAESQPIGPHRRLPVPPDLSTTDWGLDGVKEPSRTLGRRDTDEGLESL